MAAPEQLVLARLLFSDDAYWDWWAASPGVAGAISPGALLHVCADEPCGVEAPAGCDELIHVSDARRLEAEDIAEVFSNCLPRNPDAIWPADLLKPRAARLAAPRRAARPRKDSAAPPTPGAAGPRAARRTAVGHDAPVDGLVGDSVLTARVASPPLDLEPAREELRARLAAARNRFASAAPGTAAAGAFLGSAKAAPSEGKPKKRGLVEVLAERMAKVAKGPSAEATRGSSGPAAAAAAGGGAVGEGAKELATALVAVLKSSAAQVRCRQMAQDQPGKLSELTLMQVAEFLGAVEGDAAVGPTTALVLRCLLTIYLPQNPAQQIGVAACREMRTLAEAIDFLLQGKIPQAPDILTQRLKAAQVAVGDGRWGAAKWLELAPAKDEPTTLRDEEEEMIRSVELGGLKLEGSAKGSAKDGERSPRRRVAQLDETATKLPAGGSQAPLNFKAARAACPKKGGEASKGHEARVRKYMTESRGQSSGSLLASEDFPWLEAEGARSRFAAGAPPSGGQQRGLASTSLLDGARGLLAAGCAARDAEAWRDEVAVQFSTTTASVDMAAHLAQLFERHPGGTSFERMCRVAEKTWLLLTVTALNFTYSGRCKEGWRHRPTLPRVVQQATGFLKSRVVDFSGGPFEQASVPAADAALSGATVDLTQASPWLAAARACRGAGRSGFRGADVAEWLASPEKALLPEADWPDPMPRAKVNVADVAGWRELAVHLVKLGVFAVLSEDQLVRVRGEPLLNGLFAVEKKGKPGPGAGRSTRLILNMVPGNALLKPHVGEASLLAASTIWVSLHVPEGRRPERRLYIASAVIAMGWVLAALVSQHLHRRLCRLLPPRGAGLLPELELRKDEARLIVELGSGREAGWWQACIDDVDAPEIVDEARARQFVGTEAVCQQRVRERHRRACAAYSAEKAHLRETRVERMGADVDGAGGRLAAPGPMVLSTAAFCPATLSQERVPWRVCMMALGKLARALEFRRPLFGLLNSAWPLSTARSTVRYNAEMVEELSLGLMLLPTAATSLRAGIKGMVTVSGASEFGGGVCASTSLRGEAAPAFKSMSQVADHLGVGARLLNMPVDPRCPWTVSIPGVPRAVVLKVLNVLVVGLFDGVGGLAASLSMLPVRIVADVTAETDAKARQVVRLCWPAGAIDWGDVARVGENLVQDLFDAFSETVGACVAGAGSPCQDLSRLNSSGGGLHGRESSLFYEVPRVFRLLQQAFGRRFYSLLEVAGMTDENVKAMSSCMAVQPYLICSSVMAPCRRPRLFWLSWQVQVAPPLRLADKGCYLVVMADNGPLRDIEREARARWQADSLRYHAALCEDNNLAQDCSGGQSGRLPSCTERERLLGFDVSYTAAATKGSNPQAAPDARAFLLGNRFGVYAVAWDLQHAPLAESALARPMSAPEIARIGQCRGAWDQRGCFEDSSGDPNTGGRPRSSLGVFAWRWRVALSTAWPRETHALINV
ncbi:unnamed protein product [Prorocentrum cordatum]|uniref:RNA-directed RNA polymerase n=1 Tax=Prorocentrum cordatum TaxID=2364126 RepID=A0ABN9V5K0_9DINO|nr:unnamed protein product [Polarella glacialis]